MKIDPTSDFIYQLFALIISIIVVHSIYVTVIRPRAEVLLEAQKARFDRGELVDLERSIFVIMKDPEQETCFVLAFWCVAFIGRKLKISLEERKIIRPDLLEIPPGTSILPEDSRKYARALQALPELQREFLLPRTLLTALQRFGGTRNIQDVSHAIQEVCDSEWNRLDSDLSMIRYCTWVIPAIGFLGTVRGIGEALIQAQRAVMGDIVGVTVSLGVAFNATLISLVLSIIIMFLLHQLQQIQERLVLDTRRYCDANLLPHLQVRLQET
jgi:biopolymer transport protein ExbB/TolQ